MHVIRPIKLLLAGLFVSLSLLSLAPAGASSANISHSYKSSSTIQTGSLVSLDPNKSDYVELANTDNATRLLGVVVSQDDSLLAVDTEASKVQVATSGTATLLVSDVNGTIRVGDQITASPFEGVGMLQTSTGRVIGIAQTEFNSSTPGAATQTVKDKSGANRQIRVGYLRVNIGAGVTSTSSPNAKDSELNALQKLAKSITGHPVSTWRAAISLIIVLVAAAALITLTYASIYGSIISVGRNPLGASAIFHTLRSVLAMALLTAGVAGLTVFFLLH
jgi:hypothetical protein